MNFKPAFTRLSSLLSSISLTLILACNTSVDDKIEEVTPDQIRIGILAPITGPLAGFGQDFEKTARLAASEINAAGGVNGKAIGFLVRDTRLGLSDSSQVSIQMAQMLINEGVVGIIGPAGSGTTIAIAPTLIAANIPMITPSATSPALTALDDNDLIWRSVASDAFQGKFLADQLIADNINSISIIYRNDAYGLGLQQTLSDQFSLGGGSVLSRVSYSPEKTSGFDDEVSQLFSSGMPDALVIISFALDGASIMVALASKNPIPMPLLYGVDGNNRDEFIANSPAQLILGMKGSAPFAPSNSSNYIAFTENYRNTFNAPPPTFTESVYDAVYLMALAMNVGGENTSNAIRQNLRALSRSDSASGLVVDVGPSGYALALQNLSQDIDLQGAAGAIDFDINGDVTSGNYVLWQIVEINGELAFQNILESPFP